MAHRYPTRFQIKLQAEQQRAANQIALHESIEFVNGVSRRMQNLKCYYLRMDECTKLYEHLYENPILLTGYSNFRKTAWDKMNETKNSLLTALESLPAKLAENDSYDMSKRVRISNLLDLMDRVRTKYW